MFQKIWRSVSWYVHAVDKRLMLLFLAFCVLDGLVMAGVCNTFYTSFRNLYVQVAAMALGLFTIVAVSSFDYRAVARQWKIYVPVVLALVLLTFVWGAQREGADDRAWLMLPGGMSLQPSEFLKLAFILSLSLHLFSVGEEKSRLKNVMLLCLHGAVPVLLIHIQGDDGSALIFLLIFLVLIFCGGVAWPYFVAGLAAAGAAIPIVWNYMLNSDQKQRIEVLLNPGSDPLGIELQQNKAKISIGSGQIFGRGLFAGDHNYVPEIRNDFVFSFIGESLGFVGCLGVFLLFILLFVAILRIGYNSGDALGRYICIGVFAMIGFQMVLNIGMNLGLLPVIGVTLPFLSAGGSSFITVSAGIGLVMSVAVHNQDTMFEGVLVEPIHEKRVRARKHTV